MHVIRWDLLESAESREFFHSLLRKKSGTALTIGGFDGPHIGHQGLFDSVLSDAHVHNLAPGIVTFSRSPGVVKNPEHYTGDVSTLQLRLKKFEESGFHFVILIDFSSDFGRMSGGVFFEILVKTVHMRYLAVGHDFRCGHRLDTGIAEIAMLSRQEGFRFDSISQIDIDGIRVSSSAVRKAVHSADFSRAEKLLGYPFLLDFSDIPWKAFKGYFEAPRSSITQILPRCGMYMVVLQTDAEKQISAKAEITDEEIRIFLEESDWLLACNAIQTMQFRLS